MPTLACAFAQLRALGAPERDLREHGARLLRDGSRNHSFSGTVVGTPGTLVGNINAPRSAATQPTWR